MLDKLYQLSDMPSPQHLLLRVVQRSSGSHSWNMMTSSDQCLPQGPFAGVEGMTEWLAGVEGMTEWLSCADLDDLT